MQLSKLNVHSHNLQWHVFVFSFIVRDLAYDDDGQDSFQSKFAIQHILCHL